MNTACRSDQMICPVRDTAVFRPARSALAVAYEKRVWFCGLALSGAFLTCLSVVYVDRAAASWSHAARRGVTDIPGSVLLFDPFLPLIMVGLVACGLFHALSARPPAWTRTTIACCLATLAAVVMKTQLKFIFGRTCPESMSDGAPSWIGTGAYGFHPFHGGSGWASFPSGHTATVAAIAAVLWRRAPSLRWLWASLVLLVAAALYCADYHFIGDIIAGAYLGVGCGAIALTLIV